MVPRGRKQRAEGRSARSRDGAGDRSRLQVGPDHPMTRGSLSIRLDLDGETIHGAEVRIGETHRGFEKQCESGPWLHLVPFAERTNAQSSVFAGTAVCLAIEALMEIECPERAQWLRVLTAELARVADHWSRLHRVAWQLASEGATDLALGAREHALEMLERASGARALASHSCIGGVRSDLPVGFSTICETHVAAIRRLLVNFEMLMSRSQWVRDRLEGIAPLSREECVRHSVTGPLLRAAGEPIDLRRDTPYLVYDQVDFDVPIGSEGDNFDRLLVCVEEIRQSLRIVEACVETLAVLGGGVIRATDERLSADGWTREAGKGASTADSAQIPDVQVPAGEVYVAVESPNGELGFHLVSDGTAHPRRVRCRPPSLLNLQPFPRMIESQALADLGVTLALLNAVDGEFDR